MIGVPVNPNSVYVPIIQTGCLKTEFDSTYPIHLNVGTVLCVVGGLFVVKSITTFYILLSVGIVLTTFGSLFFDIGVCVMDAKRVARMRQAITEESIKYSSRSPTPCSRRLDTSRTLFGGYGYYNNSQQTLYQLVIDIGCSTSQGNVNQTHYSNKIVPEPTSSFG
ncbi:unnamed protein product [Rotaria socialis]|uniref:Uncharacterized protein n=1 Tax=Rotaria socialis TaxID=392032 RepID=A0A821IAK8_9BILA|nr:unnamed protein product [Rotaria socialis]CAF3442685.1 unnamed protein product [Rotaria socialis]CAF3468677.1 unnamed protein product [Rotaria socialis]CAF3483514.1 unnamed protein product [Rotaria socialis]CAF3516411.1 unnamed protein product [Rotaria socialis]